MTFSDDDTVGEDEPLPAQNDRGGSSAETVVEAMRREYWQAIAEVPDGRPPVRSLQILRLRLDDSSYLLPLQVCRHVLKVPEIVRVPRPPPYVLGTLAYRGEIFPWLDLRGLLELPPREPDRKSRMVLLYSEGVTAAVMVDHVDEVSEIDFPGTSIPKGEIATRLNDEPDSILLSAPEILAKVLLGIDRSHS